MPVLGNQTFERIGYGVDLGRLSNCHGKRQEMRGAKDVGKGSL